MAALYAMTDARLLDPCSYDPAKDYSPVLYDPLYQTFNTRSAYDTVITYRRFQGYLRRGEEWKRCFLNVIKAKLKESAARPAAEAPKTPRNN